MSLRPVLVAHRQTMVAEGIAAGLARYPEFSPIVVTSVLDGARHGRAPYAVVMDPELPDAEIAADVLRKDGVRVIFLGERHDEGSFGVPTSQPLDTLASALAPDVRPMRSRSTSLSPRERDVLSSITRGLAAKEIARSLGISIKTVERHKTRIFEKLGVVNQAAAAFVAAERGILGRG